MIALLLAQTIAITGGTVYPVSGPKLEHATVLMQNGRIAAVGTNVTIPAGATRVDATGKWVTPGLTDGGGQMGLVEIGAVGGTREAFYQGDSVAAAFNVAEGINPASTLIPVTRMEGVTTTLAAPGGHLISGQAVLIDLDGTTVEQMLVKSPVGILADLSEGSKDEAGNTRAGVTQRLRQVFRDALEYERRKADFARAQMQALSARPADLEALLPVLHGQLPLIAVANRKSDIATALRLARARQSSERRRVVRRSLRVHHRRPPRDHPRPGDPAPQPPDGIARALQDAAAEILTDSRRSDTRTVGLRRRRARGSSLARDA